MTSVSKALSRQPKVTTSITASGRDLAGEADRDRSGHAQMVVGTPLDLQAAAVEQDLGPPAGELAPGGRRERGASPRAAGPGDARPALPYPHADALRREEARDLDIGALGEEGMA